MIIKVQGENAKPIRTAGNPIRIGNAANDVATPVAAPALNQHRESILSELMADLGAYAPTCADANIDTTGASAYSPPHQQAAE